MCDCGVQSPAYTAPAHSARARTLRIVVKCIHLINVNRGEREHSITTERRINIRNESAEVKAQQTNNTKVGNGRGIDWVGVYIHLIYICTYKGTCCTIALQANKRERWLKIYKIYIHIKQYNICISRYILLYRYIHTCWFVYTQSGLTNKLSVSSRDKQQVPYANLATRLQRGQYNLRIVSIRCTSRMCHY